MCNLSLYSSLSKLRGKFVYIVVCHSEILNPEILKQNCNNCSLFSDLSGTKVHLWSQDGIEAEVFGLDHNGFLQVHSEEHGVVSVEPDGNSFDMLKNLVVIKQR